MTAAEHCRKHGWKEGYYFRVEGRRVCRIIYIGHGGVLLRRQDRDEFATDTIPPTAVRVLNYAGDPLPAAESPEVTR